MYRFGDGTPFPIQENFIDTLLAAIDASVGTFAAAVEIEERREKARAVRRQVEDELRRLGGIEQAIESALAPMRPSADRSATAAQQAAARALGAARHALGQSRTPLDQRLHGVSGEPRVERARARARAALAGFFERHWLPDTAWRTAWTWDGQRASGTATATAGTFRAELELALEPPWTHVVRVDAVAPGLRAEVPRRTLLGGRRATRISLDRSGIVGVEQAADRQVIVVREHAGKPSPGWRIVLRDGERAAGFLVPIDAGGQPAAAEVAIADDDGAAFARLWVAVDDALVAMREGRRRLTELYLGDAALERIADPASVGRALLGVLGPLVRQIRLRSRVPGELAIKRDVGDGHRDELYVPRADVERRFASLPATYRRPFEEIGLGRLPTADPSSHDDVQTVPEVTVPRPPPIPEPARPDVLARLPPVPPTLPRVTARDAA
jgi:hypothetical protein